MRTQPCLSLGRRGVTLIELLVVIAIIGALAVAVLPNLTNTAEARRGREAARMVSSFIAKAQSRAIGRREPAGFMLASANAVSFAAVDLLLADVPPPYRGDTTDATITMAATGDKRRSGTASNGGLADVTRISATTSDLVRFGGRGPFYELTEPPTTAGIEIRMLGFEDLHKSPDDLGYTSLNTPWPAPAPLPFEIFRKPEPAGSPLSLDGGRAIDMFWSGYGPPNVGTVVETYRRFTNPGSRISVVFDGTGRLRQIVEATPTATNRRAITGAVFLLVGRLDRVPINPAGPNAPNLPAFDPTDDSTGANWQYPDSWWIAIDALTGMAKTAECRPGATTVEESQQWIREALLTSGR